MAQQRVKIRVMLHSSSGQINDRRRELLNTAPAGGGKAPALPASLNPIDGEVPARYTENDLKVR